MIMVYVNNTTVVYFNEIKDNCQEDKRVPRIFDLPSSWLSHGRSARCSMLTSNCQRE